MADTFLNTARTGMATSNVQANVNQVNGQENITNNVNGTVGVSQPVQQNQPQNNQVNPITIPIQIQPQIAPTGQSETTQVQPSQNLQVGNQQTYNAPTPQQYNSNYNNSNNNVVDFNQIYRNYNEMAGRSNLNTQSGIKKTSFNTTIVTPTALNLNTVQGQYQSAYSDTINGVISTMLTQVEQLRTGEFGYDPAQDMALRMASEYAANSTLQSLAGSGVLNSSATAERVARIVSELIPAYEEKAYNRQIQYLSQLADTAQLVMNYDNQQFQYWKDAKDREFKEKEFELAKMREQAQIEHANNVALTRLKNDLNLQTSKALAQYENSLKQSNMEYEYQLAKKYGTSSNSKNSNFSMYDDIIKNRYAEYDDFTKQYVVPDQKTYNELGNYLDQLYASGAITEAEFLQLSAKYSKYANNNSNETKTTPAQSTTQKNSGGIFNTIGASIEQLIKNMQS